MGLSKKERIIKGKIWEYEKYTKYKYDYKYFINAYWLK